MLIIKKCRQLMLKAIPIRIMRIRCVFNFMDLFHVL